MRERSTKNFPSKTDNGKRMFLATHFVNHKRQSCQDNYNPNKVKEVVPEAKLMCAVASRIRWMTYRSSTYPARFLELPIVIADSLKEVTNDKKIKFITLTYY